MALEIKKIKSITILEPGTANERVLVSYDFGASEYPNLELDRNAEIPLPASNVTYQALKGLAIAEAKKKHGIQ